MVLVSPSMLESLKLTWLWMVVVVGVRLLERAEETAQPKRLAPKELDTLVRTTCTYTATWL